MIGASTDASTGTRHLCENHCGAQNRNKHKRKSNLLFLCRHPSLCDCATSTKQDNKSFCNCLLANFSQICLKTPCLFMSTCDCFYCSHFILWMSLGLCLHIFLIRLPCITCVNWYQDQTDYLPCPLQSWLPQSLYTRQVSPAQDDQMWTQFLHLKHEWPKNNDGFNTVCTVYQTAPCAKQNTAQV